MTTKKQILEACREAGINPNRKGNYIFAGGWPEGAFPTPVDLSTIDFPINDAKQVQELGIIVNNLHSQLVVMPKSQKESQKNKSLEGLIKLAENSLNGWFEKGMKKCETGKREFVLYAGNVFEQDLKTINMWQKADEIFKQKLRRGEGIKGSHSPFSNRRKYKILA